MKTITALICGLVASVALAGEPSDELPPEFVENQRAKAGELVTASDDTVVMAVSGMYCPNCAASVKDEVKKLAFVRGDEVEVDGERALLVVKLKKPGVVNRSAIVNAIREAGYEPIRYYRYADGEAKEQVIEPQV